MEEKKSKFEVSFSAFDFNIEEDKKVSTASLEKLKDIFPEKVYEEKVVDLLPVSFNLATVNSFNKKKEGIGSQTAVSILHTFKDHPTNIEHDNKEIVGHIIGAKFTSIIDNRIIDEEEALQTEDPYYISLSAYIYKLIFPDFAKLLEKSNDPESPFYKKISASWEIGYNDFDIAIGSNNLKECFCIGKNDSRFNTYKKMLKKYKGKGVDENGNDVNLLVKGVVYPLGIGFTTDPAAYVEGVYVEKFEKTTSELKSEELVASKISHNEKNNVTIFNKTNNGNMDAQELIQEISKLVSEKKDMKFSEETIANMTSLINEKIRERDALYTKEKEELEKQKIEASQKSEQRQKEIDEMSKTLKEAKEEISALKASMDNKEKAEAFNVRMNSLDEEFDLTDEDRKIIASDLKSIDTSEESYASYKGKIDVLFKEKSKAYKKQKEEMDEKRIQEEVKKRVAKTKASDCGEEEEEGKKSMAEKSKASNKEEDSQEDLENFVNKAEASEKEPENNNAASAFKKESLVDSLKENFRKNTTIKY